MDESGYSLQPLFEVIDRLRGQDGCPWDRKQTPKSFIKYLAEEAEELAQAIHNSDRDNIREEFGDVLFLLVFLTRLLEADGGLVFSEAVNEVVEKMKRRHPHVYGDVSVSGADEVVLNWNRIKRIEKQGKAETVSEGPGPDDLD